MASRSHTPVSPSPQRSSAFSPALSAIRSFSLSSSSLGSYPITSSPFSSSPILPSTQPKSSPSPDFFEDFTYSQDMDDDLRRIDQEVAETYQQINHPNRAQNSGVNLALALPRDRKTWVVFRGKVPGIYEYSELAAFQTQGFSDAFQRLFPDRDSAEIAWSRFVRDGTYPDYGRGPWIVFLGRKPGVFSKITELECSVKGYNNAVFRSCSSVTEGNIKFHLFAERVIQMFAGSDPFSDVDSLILQPEDVDEQEGSTPAAQPATPVLAIPKLPPVPQAVGPQNTASNYAPESSKSALNTGIPGLSKSVSIDDRSSSAASPLHIPGVPRPGDGWYVAHRAALPGVYGGVDALKEAKPKPGGFLCAPDKKSADMMFHKLAFNGAIVWTSGDE